MADKDKKIAKAAKPPAPGDASAPDGARAVPAAGVYDGFEARYESLVRGTKAFLFTVEIENQRPVRSWHFAGSEEVTGYTAEEYRTDPDLWHRMILEEDRPLVDEQVASILAGYGPRTIEHRIRHKNGSVRWIRNTSVPRFARDGRLIAYDGLVADISEIKELEAGRRQALEQMSRMAMTDAVSDLLNRRGFERELTRIWTLGERQKLPTGLLIVDLDHFKATNDTYGHPVGDEIIRESARLLERTVRASDLVCRYGGDEMAVLLPLTTEEDTRTIAERVLQAFREKVFCAGSHDLHVQISVGAACSRDGPSRTADRLVRQADQALYHAKRTGRNRLCFWNDQLVAGEDRAAGPVPAPPGGGAAVPAAGAPAREGRILVVDDEPAVGRMLAAMLKRESFDVDTVLNSADAIRLITAHFGQYDLALIDLNLQGENGLDLLARIRNLDETLVGIVITGMGTFDAAVSSLRSGAYDFVNKPITLDQLRTVIQRAMKYRRLLLQNYRYRMHLEDMVQEKSSRLQRALGQLEQAYRFTLESLAAILDARESKTGEHSNRVSKITELLARKMGVDVEDLPAMTEGALIHDIGKVALPDRILLKPGPLTAEEWRIVKTHPEVGFNILRGSSILQRQADIVLQHHERYDGSGYPQGLAGDRICLGARIFAVADSYDAIRADRPYSRGRTPHEALAEIRRGRGHLFDPVVVDALEQCLDDIESRFQAQWSGAPRP